jgi:hypothetical protein
LAGGEAAAHARSVVKRATGRKGGKLGGTDLRPAGAPTSLDVLSLVPPPAPPPVHAERGPAPPAGYGEDRVVVMVRDPGCLFVYWELGGGGWQEAVRRHGLAEMTAGSWVLRVEHFHEQRSGLRYFDVAVDPAVGNRYLHVEPSALYRVRIGVILSSGKLVDLAASPTMATPPASVSCRTDGKWQMTREEFEHLSVGIPGGELAGSSHVLGQVRRTGD